MAATTTLLGLVTPTQGTLSGTWGDTVNYGISDYVDIAIAGTLLLNGDGPVTLANTLGSASGNGITTTTAQYMVIRVTGTLTTPKIITGPSYSKLYLVDNAATGSTVSFIRAGQTPAVSIAVGESAFVYYNGTDYIKVASDLITALAGTLAVANGGTGVTSSTGTGSVVLSTSPTLVTPLLGTPTSGNVGACTVDGTNLVGYRAIPQSGAAKTTSYTLAVGDVGEFIEVGSGGSIVVPDATFAAGDAVVIFNNTSGAITLTMSITTAYIGGTDADKATISLATRGICNVLFISGTVCVVTGNVT
jgi:hypothetical protein